MNRDKYNIFIKVIAVVVIVFSLLLALYVRANRNAGRNLPLTDWEQTLTLENIVFTLITIVLFIVVYNLIVKAREKKRGN
jgi:phosphatidylglycerophosphate synthase